MNQDGRLDFICADAAENSNLGITPQVRWYENTGDMNNFVPHVGYTGNGVADLSGTTVPWWSHLAVGDLDHDGDIDVVVSTGVPQALLNDGQGNFTEAWRQTDGIVGNSTEVDKFSWSVYLVDMDLDGVLELYGYGFHGGLTYGNNLVAPALTPEQIIEELLAEIAALDADIANLTAQLAACHNNGAQLQSQLGSAQANVASLESALASAQANVATQYSEIAALQTQLETANAEATTLQSELDNAHADIASLTEQLENANRAIETLTDKFAAAQNTIATQAEAITSLESQLASTVANFTAERKQLNTQISVLNENLDSANAQIAQLQTSLDQSIAKYHTVLKDYNAAKKQIQSLQTDLEAANAKVAAQAAKIAKQQNSIAALIDEARAVDSSITGLESALSDRLPGNFVIPGKSADEKIATLAEAIAKMNRGQRAQLIRDISNKKPKKGK